MGEEKGKLKVTPEQMKEGRGLIVWILGSIILIIVIVLIFVFKGSGDKESAYGIWIEHDKGFAKTEQVIYVDKNEEVYVLERTDSQIKKPNKDISEDNKGRKAIKLSEIWWIKSDTDITVKSFNETELYIESKGKTLGDKWDKADLREFDKYEKLIKELVK